MPRADRRLCEGGARQIAGAWYPRELIDTADVPGGEPLRLFRRGADFMIVLDRNELMNSRMSGSEEALAEMTIDRLRGPRRRIC